MIGSTGIQRKFDRAQDEIIKELNINQAFGNSQNVKRIINETYGINMQADLQYLSFEKISLSELRSWVELWGQTIQAIGEILATVAIGFLVLFALWLRILPWIKGFFFKRLDIEDFNKGAVGDIAQGLEVLIEESLNRFETEGRRQRVHLVAGPISELKIPASIKDATPQLNIISDLIEWALPQKVIALSGYLQKTADRGAGLTLSLVEKWTGNIVANNTIWQKDYDPMMKSSSNEKDPMPYYRLADMAATWTLFQLHASSEGGFLTKLKQNMKTFFKLPAPSEEFIPLGTKDWQSYAYFKAGVSWSLEGEKEKARQLYVEALSRDINNRGALFNLGVIDMESGEYDKAVERLLMARNSAEKEKTNNLYSDPVWYSAMYQLAASYQYKVIKAEEGQELNEAEETAKILVTKINEAIESLRKNENKVLKQYLESFRPMAVILYAGILFGRGKEKEAESLIESLKPFSLLSYRVRYNLACYYSIAGNKKEGKEQTNAYKDALFHLNYALERGGDIVQWAKRDPSLKGVREDEKTKDFFDRLTEKDRTTTPDSSDMLHPAE